MSGIGVNLRVTGHCNQGGRKYMEDMFTVAYQQTDDFKDLQYAFFGIFDGHGGPEAAVYAKEHLLDFIVTQPNFWSSEDDDVLKAIRDGYLAAHNAMWKDLAKWPRTLSGLPSTSGCTATVLFIMKGKIYVGHVGDTALVLGYEEDGFKDWKAKYLTKDHKPESKEEKHRIEQCGGKVVNKSGVSRVVWNRPRLGHLGPVRRSTHIDEIPFLAVARSLGDFWSYNSGLDEFVVSPEPDVSVVPVDVNHFRCLVLGTDGLWNMITAEKAVNIVQATELNNEKKMVSGHVTKWLNPSKALVDRALDRWYSANVRADNTSVVTLLLDPPGPPRSKVLLQKIAGESPVSQGETVVPESGGMALFTHYPQIDGSCSEHKENSHNEKPRAEEKRVKYVDTYFFKTDEECCCKSQKEAKTVCMGKSIVDETGDDSGIEDSSPIGPKHNNNTSSSSEEKREGANIDVEADRACERRRLTVEQKSRDASTQMRTSLQPKGTSGKVSEPRCETESTSVLRIESPMKTLRSRNIELNDKKSDSATSKRNRNIHLLVDRKLEIDTQHCITPMLGKRKSSSRLDLTVDSDGIKSQSNNDIGLLASSNRLRGEDGIAKRKLRISTGALSSVAV